MPRSLQFDEMLGDTLAQVNVVRTALGREPLFELPDARPGDSSDCLYYRGLKDIGCQGVGTGSMTFSSERQAKLVAELWGTQSSGTNVTSPQGIRRVINEFDNHNVRDYDV